METKVYAFDAVLHEEPDGGAYIIFPYDLRREFGKGRAKVRAEFNGIPYDGSIVNMGVKDGAGGVCYILGVLKSIRKRLGVADGGRINVRITAEENSAPQTIDEYIARQDAAAQPRLRELRALLRGALPQAEERLSWSMPTYWQGRNLIHFAAAKNHLGIYPGGEATAVFARELEGFDVSKGTIRIPWAADLPADLITRIARWCLETYGK